MSIIVFKMGWLLCLLFAVLFYFLPSIVASSRNTHNKNGILILNIILGWTIFGWVVALVMACGSQAEK